MTTPTTHKFDWLNDYSRRFLKGGYLVAGETPESRVADIAAAAAAHLDKNPDFEAKFNDYTARGFYSLSSPVWSNFGRERGLPISCFGSYIDDTMESIADTNSEVMLMSKHGGGTSAYFGALRPRGSKVSAGGESDGAVSFARLFDTSTDISKQAAVRRGSMAAYLPIEHGDIREFLNIRKEGNPIQHLLSGVTVGDEWMQSMIDGDPDKRAIWAKVLESRSETGIPYILFRDNANNNKPQVYKDKGLDIVASNLCSEIMLPSDAYSSFVCCLSSMNLARYDEWKDTDAVETLVYFLDAVMSEFIIKARKVPHLTRAVNFATIHRAIGLGALGWHTLLQERMIPFEGLQASCLNTEVFRLLDERTRAASEAMAEEYGEAPLLKGYGLRHATRMAIAPTTSSSTILGQVSQSIEPLKSNYFVKDLAKLKYTFRNPTLKKLLAEKGEDKATVWQSILENNGSVQHLDFLTEDEKDVFRTFSEISQLDVVKQAAQRQKFIDQGQSLNVMIHPSTPAKEINGLMIEAWRSGVKSLYYSHSMNAAQELYRSLNHCSACEG